MRSVVIHARLFWDIKPLHTESRVCVISFIWMSQCCRNPLDSDLSTFHSRAWTRLALQFSCSCHSLSVCLMHAVCNPAPNKTNLHDSESRKILSALFCNSIIKLNKTHTHRKNKDWCVIFAHNSKILHGQCPTMEWPTMKTGRSGWRTFITSMCCRESLM